MFYTSKKQQQNFEVARHMNSFPDEAFLSRKQRIYIHLYIHYYLYYNSIVSMLRYLTLCLTVRSPRSERVLLAKFSV